MAQFHCPVCDEGFEQQSRLERYLQTSHPAQAPSAADLEKVLKGVDYPLTSTQAIRFVRSQGRSPELLEQLPDQTFRDAAEVVRALGEALTGESKPRHQPSRRGGEQAARSNSAAGIAGVFEGATFPASAEDLKAHARSNADKSTRQIVDRFRTGTFYSMADVMRELGKVS